MGNDWYRWTAADGVRQAAIVKAENAPDTTPEEDALRTRQLRLIDTLREDRERRDAARGRGPGCDQAGRRGDGVLDRLHERVGEHLLLERLALRSCERRLARRDGGTDGEPFAEIVEADAERDEERNRQRSELPVAAAPGGERQETDERGKRDDPYEHGGVERSRGFPRQLERLAERVDGEKDEQADGQRKQEIDSAPPQPAKQGICRQPERHRNDAHVKSEQAEFQEPRRTRTRSFGGDLDLREECYAVSRDQLDFMGLALDPGIRDLDRRSTQTTDSRARLDREGPYCVVDNRLVNGDRIHSPVEYMHADQMGLRQLDPLDRELLDRRRTALEADPTRQ